MNDSSRTIFAPATQVGESSITVIRVSGKDTFEITSRIFSKKPAEFEGVDFSRIGSHTALHGYLLDKREFIDEVVVTVFKAPNSYTGEDVVEISSHGGSFVFNRISELLSKSRCEHAEPGEFSKRAFLNGKMDLAQAEAIADIIRAKTELSSKAAMQQLKGVLSSRIEELRLELINYCSLVELELDFTEENLEIIPKNILLEKIDNIIQKIEIMAKSYNSGRIIKDGVNLTIAGKPNAGKSTIFNFLLNESRAIVSHVPGTTRDYLQEPLIMGGFVFNLIDTAGIRHSGDLIEREGVQRSFSKIEEADIVLNVIDLSGNGSLKSESEIKNVDKSKVISVYNKVDLAPAIDKTGINVSAKTGENMHLLEENIIEKAKSLVRKEDVSEIFITSSRHRDCLLKSCEYLVNARRLVTESAGNELISFEIREAMGSLNEIMGKTTNVDILNNIFSKFCIGK